VELDGVARRIVLAPPDVAEDALPGVIGAAGIEAAVSDAAQPIAGLPTHAVALPVRFQDWAPAARVATEWVMFTSGTSGPPKMAVHSLEGLTGAIKPPTAGEAPPIWGTFYDIRRYGGLQILLRALLGDGSLAITAPSEPMPTFLGRLARLGVTHLTGTPSHWRRALMTPEAAHLAPAYVRLSGEIADQAVLDALKARFPGAPVGHAYASTEAGVGFEVNDGLAGFPAAYVGRPGEVALRVTDRALQLKSARAAAGYIDGRALAGDDGFVDTGDMVELRGDRYHFVGRRGGVINVGGLKAHPEEIEAVINTHPAVRMSRVTGRRSPITGAIVAADVVLRDPHADEAAAKADILATCRKRLAPFKVPAMLRLVPSLPMTAGGKLERAVA
jgi:acyl-coenzyme A synthetase/AMP-(fatty) acid ligase